MPDSPVPPPVAGPLPRRRLKLRIVVLVVIAILVVLFLAIQLVPVNRTNPAVTTPINWDSPQTEVLARRACMDCHSNETTWPVYSYIAPVSWLVYYDVQRGRSQLNLSTYATSGGQFAGSPFGQSGDLAYQLGQLLAGGQRGPGGFGDRGGFGGPPNGGTFPTPAPGQQGQFPPGGFGGFGGGNRISEVIQNGSMPPSNYTLLHPSAILTEAERAQLLQGLQATLGLTSTTNNP
jgi:hypothetical protein